MAGEAGSGRGRRSTSVPQVVWSAAAVQDVARLHAFLAAKSQDAAQRAIRTIRSGVEELSKHPGMGRLVEDMLPEFREWVVPFGQGAYVAFYHFDGRELVILAVRHGREAGY